MMLRFTFFMCLSVMLFSCKKESSSGPTTDSVKNMLTGGVTKTWTLSKMFVNGTQATLTAGQARYTKTFKTDNTWIDSDGYVGTYTVPNTTALIEITTNMNSGSRTISYTIKSISVTSLEVEYSIASTTYRLIFSL
jgi:hypothetical protein